MSSFECILHPTDFSDSALRALEYAVDFSVRLGAELHLLHVVAPRSSAITAELDAPPSAAATAQLKARMQAALPPGVTALLAVRTGTPPAQIVAYADALPADLIIIGTRAPEGLQRLLLGSTADQVLRSAGCPVVVVGPSLSSAARPIVVAGPSPS